jgi:hypothetical protein
VPAAAPDGATVRGLINPLVLWVWYGGGIMGLGVILNIFRPRRREAAAFSPATLTPDPAPGLASNGPGRAGIGETTAPHSSAHRDITLNINGPKRSV